MLKKSLVIFLLVFAFTGAGCTTKEKNTTAPPQESTNTIEATITLKADDSSYTMPFQDNLSVYDTMVMLRDKQDFDFDGKDYGEDMGFFVDSINGVKSDTESNLYWVFYINDKKSDAGISATYLNPNDTITWKYEPLQF